MPSKAAIEFALRIFRELVEPTMDILEALMKSGLYSKYGWEFAYKHVGTDVPRDANWRNDFCRYVTSSLLLFLFPLDSKLLRYLTFVRNAFAGIPTLCEERIPKEYFETLISTSDIL